MTPCPADLTRDCEYRSIGEFVDQSGRVGVVQVSRCVNCGHGISLPPISDPAFLYEGRDSQDFQPNTAGFASTIKRIAFRRAARRLLRQLGQAPIRLLDFGCGNGQFTEQLGTEMRDGRVMGSDFFPDPPRGLSCEYLPNDALACLEGTFDTVLALHVVEHDDDATALLKRIGRTVVPGGTLVIEVPNVECVWARIFGKHWDAWYLPFHRQHFNRRSLRAAIECAGFELITIHSETVPTMGRTLRNIFGIRGELFWLLIGIVCHPVQLLGEWIGGESSALRAIARRPVGELVASRI